MKILQINRYHYRVGGSETVYFNTADLLEANGHEVYFFAMDYPQNVVSKEKEFFTKAFDFNSGSLKNKIKNFKNFFYNTDAKNSLERLIRKIKPDVAHIHLFYGSLTSSILVVLKKYHIPVVITEHDYRLVCPAYVFLDGKNRLCEKCQGQQFYHCITNKCAKNSYLVSLLFSLEAYYRNLFYSPKAYMNKIIFVSRFSMEIHLKHNPGLKDQAVQLYNFTPKVKKKYTPKKGSYFLYIGRLSYEKGIFNLMEAFNKRPDLTLKIAGSGPLLDEVLIRKNSNIEYYGFAKDAALEDLILNCSFVVVPSEWYETLCMSAVEALALGKPVIAAKIGGLPEVVKNGENGFLFEAFSQNDLLSKIDVANALTTEEYNSFSERALSSEDKKFSGDVHYEELIKIYQSAITDHNN